MDFLKILRSFEEFIFEAATWLLFYPVTLWRIITRPLALMRYSDHEQAERRDEGRYDDSISPPLLLLFTLVLTNAIGIAFHMPPPESTSASMKVIANSPQNLALFRALIFSILPLVAAVTVLKAMNARVSRETLRPPFYAQCYLSAPVAMAITGGNVIYQRNEVDNAWGIALMTLAALWFAVTQTRWFASKLETSKLRALGLVCLVVLISAIYMLLIFVPVALL